MGKSEKLRENWCSVEPLTTLKKTCVACTGWFSFENRIGGTMDFLRRKRESSREMGLGD